VRILITGASGQLGTDLARLAARHRHHDVVAANQSDLDVADRDLVLAAVTGLQPDLVLHAAAWTAVDACESDPDRAWRVNALACRHVAEAAGAVKAHLVTVSTDYVFDGTSPVAYTEWDPPNPQSVYGRSKLGGEREVEALLPGATVVRTSWLFSRRGPNLVTTMLELAAGGGPLRFVDDQRGCPTFTEDLAPMLLRLGTARRPGRFHVTNQGSGSRFEVARQVVSLAGFDPAIVEPVATADLVPPRPAPRPANSVLDNAALRGCGIPLLPHYQDSLERVIKALTA
jgi:dTDP-4-dehydrorhamnose reductase